MRESPYCRLEIRGIAQLHLAVAAAGASSREWQRLRRLQEVDQVLHRLRREAYLEALVIEIHDLLQIGCYSVMEVRCTCGLVRHLHSTTWTGENVTLRGPGGQLVPECQCWRWEWPLC